MSIIKFVTPCLLALSILFSGCAHVERPRAQPPSKETRASFGTVGVVSAETVIKGDFGAPTSGKGAGAMKGAGTGALLSILGGTAMGFESAKGGSGEGTATVALGGMALGVGLSPLFALGGTFYGAIAAEPKAKVKEAEDTINSALKDIDIRQDMLLGVFKAARERTSCNVIPVFVPVKEDLASPGAGVGYKDLKEFGVDTALVVSVTEYGLGAVGGINPELPLILKVRVRLVRCPSGAELYANEFTYLGRGRKEYLDWAAVGAKPLVSEIDYAKGVLSRQVVDEALLGVPTVPYAGGPGHEDTILYLPPFRPRKAPADQNDAPRYVPGFEPKAPTNIRGLFGPTDKHGWGDEEGHPW